MLEFVLDDGSGWLTAGLWREDAVSRLSPSLSFDLFCWDRSSINAALLSAVVPI